MRVIAYYSRRRARIGCRVARIFFLRVKIFFARTSHLKARAIPHRNMACNSESSRDKRYKDRLRLFIKMTKSNFFFCAKQFSLLRV